MTGPLGPLDGVRHIVENARAMQQSVDDILGTKRRGQPDTAPEPSEEPTQDRPLLIGLGGKLAAGKDTLADYLVTAYGFEKLGMSDPLATALYTLNPIIDLEHEGMHDWAEEADWSLEEGRWARYRDIHDIAGYTLAKRIPEVRRLLQVLGTEVGRDQLGEDTWTNVARRRIEDIRAVGTPVILTGIRYANERELIDSLGGILVWIERPGTAQSDMDAITKAIPVLEGTQEPAGDANIGSAVIRAIDNALTPERAAYHSSEVTLTRDDFHVVVTNDGSIETLQRRGDGLIETLHRLKAEALADLETPEA